MAELRLKELTPAVGVEVEGMSGPRDLDEDECRLLRKAFDDRGVLVFRGLDIDAEYQSYLAGMLVAEKTPIDRKTAESSAVVYPASVSNKEPGGNVPYGRLLFHSDMMWADEPMQLLSLYGVRVEQPSVPTIFASTAHAWDTLPDELRQRVEGKSAVHETGQQARGGNQEELLKPVREHSQSTTKPIGNRHPRTGRTLLYVSQMMTREVVDMPPAESEQLLEALFAHLYNPAQTLKHAWRDGDLVLWDNLSVHHGRPFLELEGPERTLRKVIAPRPVQSSSQPETPRYSRAG